MKSTSNLKYLGTSLLIIFFVPFYVSASVLVTEIMYDLPGADSGREWVEVTNTGDEAVDLTDYRLAESGTNHLLTLVSGSMTLAPGASAVIADNKDKFLIDWPSFSGTLIDSAFSFGNSSSTVEFKNADLITLDAAAYVSDGGAAGDGNSLHRVDSSLVPGAPNPGVFSTSAPEPIPAPEPEPEPTPAATSTATTTTSTTTQPPAQSTSATTYTQPPTPATANEDEGEENEEVESAPAPQTAATSQPTYAQTVATTKASAKTAPKSKSSSGRVAGTQTESVLLGDEFEGESKGTSLWLYVAGLVTVVVMGVAAALFARTQTSRETKVSTDEFKIE